MRTSQQLSNKADRVLHALYDNDKANIKSRDALSVDDALAVRKFILDEYLQVLERYSKMQDPLSCFLLFFRRSRADAPREVSLLDNHPLETSRKITQVSPMIHPESILSLFPMNIVAYDSSDGKTTQKLLERYKQLAKMSLMWYDSYKYKRGFANVAYDYDATLLVDLTLLPKDIMWRLEQLGRTLHFQSSFLSLVKDFSGKYEELATYSGSQIRVSEEGIDVDTKIEAFETETSQFVSKARRRNAAAAVIESCLDVVSLEAESDSNSWYADDSPEAILDNIRFMLSFGNTTFSRSSRRMTGDDATYDFLEGVRYFNEPLGTEPTPENIARYYDAEHIKSLCAVWKEQYVDRTGCKLRVPSASTPPNEMQELFAKLKGTPVHDAISKMFANQTKISPLPF